MLTFVPVTVPLKLIEEFLKKYVPAPRLSVPPLATDRFAPSMKYVPAPRLSVPPLATDRFPPLK